MNTKNDIVCFMTNAIFVLGWILVAHLSYQEFKTDIYEYEANDMCTELCCSNQTPTFTDTIDSTQSTKASNNAAYIYLGQTNIMTQYNK